MAVSVYRGRVHRYSSAIVAFLESLVTLNTLSSDKIDLHTEDNHFFFEIRHRRHSS
jgi:hypothetical protein